MSEPDLSEFYELSKGKGNKPLCKVGLAIKALSPDDARALDAAMEECRRHQIKVGAIQQWLEARDQDVSGPAVVNHRDRKCTCADG